MQPVSTMHATLPTPAARTILTILALPLALPACADDGSRGDASVSLDGGDRDGGELPTYDWCSTSTDNCWKASLATLSACAPTDGTFGTLSADGLSCAYADGSSVAFAASVIPFAPDDVDATLSRDGSFCGRVIRDGLSLSVESAIGVLTLAVDAAARQAEVTCPDGRRYQLTGTPSCGMDPDDWPFVITERTGGGEAGLDLGGGPSGPVAVFDCLPE